MIITDEAYGKDHLEFINRHRERRTTLNEEKVKRMDLKGVYEVDNAVRSDWRFILGKKI